MAKVGRPNMQVINQIDLDDIPKILPLLSLAEQEQLLAELDKLEKLKTQHTINPPLRERRRLGWIQKGFPSSESGISTGCRINRTLSGQIGSLGTGRWIPEAGNLATPTDPAACRVFLGRADSAC